MKNIRHYIAEDLAYGWTFARSSISAGFHQLLAAHAAFHAYLTVKGQS